MEKTNLPELIDGQRVKHHILEYDPELDADKIMVIKVPEGYDFIAITFKKIDKTEDVIDINIDDIHGGK